MKFNGLISEPVINTDVAAEPVLPADAKTYLRISNTTEDTLITSLIKTARIMLEKYTGRYFKPVNITVRFKNEIGEGTLFYLPTGAVIYKDPDGVVVTDFDLKNSYDGIYSATYDTGYATLPEDLKTAILAQTAFLYFNRGDDNKMGKISEVAKLLASNYKVQWI